VTVFEVNSKVLTVCKRFIFCNLLIQFFMEKENNQSPQNLLPKDFFKQFKNKEEFHSFFNTLFKQGVEEMLHAELDDHLGYEKYSKDASFVNTTSNRALLLRSTPKTGKVIKKKFLSCHPAGKGSLNCTILNGVTSE
jgi:hypothetical protein